MICTRCGNQCPDNTRFCTKCGNDLTIVGAAQQAADYQWADPQQTAYDPQQAAAYDQQAAYYDQTMQQPPAAAYDQMGYQQAQDFSGWSQLKESKYDGTVFETFIAFLVTSLIAGITFGIATPWATCYLYNFVLSHVIIDGKRLTFDGTGGQLFGNWIKWFVFIVITGGIYGIWVYPRMFEWMAKHTHFAE